jgi:hypothetical protein
MAEAVLEAPSARWFDGTRDSGRPPRDDPATAQQTPSEESR